MQRVVRHKTQLNKAGLMDLNPLRSEEEINFAKRKLCIFHVI